MDSGESPDRTDGNRVRDSGPERPRGMGRTVLICVLVWMAGALVVGFLVPLVPLSIPFSPGSELPAGYIPFGSPMHLALWAALALVVAPVAGLCTGFFAWKWLKAGKDN